MLEILSASGVQLLLSITYLPSPARPPYTSIVVGPTMLALCISLPGGALPATLAWAQDFCWGLKTQTSDSVSE